MSPAAYSWIITVLAPVSTFIIASLFVYGAIFSRFRRPFGVIAFGGLLFFLPQMFWLIVKLQQSFGILMFTRELAHILFGLQALCSYAAVAVTIVGDALLSGRLVGSPTRTRPNYALQRTACRSDVQF